MTRKPIAIIAIIVLFSAGIWGMSQYRKSDSTTQRKEIDFSYDKTEEISRIFFANKSKKSIDLTKDDNGTWMLNGNRKAWQKKVDILLETIKKVRVKGTAPKPARENVIKDMAISGIKVEIYVNNSDEASLIYYVGGTTPDQLGTYFWMEGAKTPYVTYIPGFTGYLNSRFDLQQRNWISPTLFELEREQIASVSLRLNNRYFKIINNDGGAKMVDSVGNAINANPQAITSYLNHFRKLNMEATLPLVEEKVDSILNTQPFAELSVEDTEGKTMTLNLYHKPSYDKMHNLYTEDGQRLTYDPNRYYACWKGSRKFMIVQDYTFAKVLKFDTDFRGAD